MSLKKIFLILSVILLSLTTAYSASSDYDFGKLEETLLNQDPDPVEPGEYVEIRFKVEKSGNKELKNIKYELVPQYPFEFDSSDTPVKELGDWKGFSDNKEYYTLYYKLRVDENALKDTYNLTLKQTADNQAGVRNIDVPIRVDKKKRARLSLGNIKTNPKEILADYNGASMEVEVVNIGDDDAEEVITDIKLPEEFEKQFSFSNRDKLGTIKAGESKTATYYFDTKEGIESKEYPTSVNVSFIEDNDNSKTKKNLSFNTHIPVFGKPKYKILDYDLTSNLSPGDKGKIKIDVENIGSKEGKDVTFQVFKDSSQPFTFEEKTDYIGNLKVGEKGTAVISFSVDENAQSKVNKLKTQLRSVVDEEVIVEEKTLDIKINKPSTNNLEYLEETVATIIVILLIIASYFAGKKNQRKKSKSKKNK